MQVPDQREGEDKAPSVSVRHPAEGHGADPKAGEQCEHESARAGHLERCQHAENAEGLRGEQTLLRHARNDIGGEEQIVELEAGAERDQDDQVPDVPAAGEAVEPGGEFRRGWGGHPGLSSGDWGGRYRSGGGCGDDEITSSHTEVGAALQSEAAALKGRGCVAVGGGSAQGSGLRCSRRRQRSRSERSATAERSSGDGAEGEDFELSARCDPSRQRGKGRLLQPIRIHGAELGDFAERTAAPILACIRSSRWRRMCGA